MTKIGAPRITGPGYATSPEWIKNPQALRDYHREYGAKRYAARRGWWLSTMANLWCASCGGKAVTLRHRDPETFEFVPGLRSISYNSGRIMTEIAKTVPLCRSCLCLRARYPIDDLPTVDISKVEPPPW